MSTPQFYYEQQGQRQGPFLTTEIAAFVSTDRISVDTPVIDSSGQ
jgi:hypothetical protein